MKNSKVTNNCSKLIGLFSSLIVLVLLSNRVQAQGEGPLVYPLVPIGTNSLSVTQMDMTSNMNFSGSILIPGAEIESDITAINYNRFFAVGDRFAEIWATGIFGSVEGEVVGTPIGTVSADVSGMSDPYFAMRVGLVGAPALTPAEFVKYKQGFQLHGLVGLAPAWGDYDDNKPLNLGTNRWSLRLGLPMVIPFHQAAKPTRLELVPSLYIYGDNDEPFRADSREQDPLFVVEAHLVHNFTPNIWGGLGLRYQKGGETETDGIADNNEIDQLGGDVELGYKFSNSWQAFVTYGEVLSENDGSESDMWRMRLIYLF